MLTVMLYPTFHPRLHIRSYEAIPTDRHASYLFQPGAAVNIRPSDIIAYGVCRELLPCRSRARALDKSAR
jgi:hypothetical protein